MKKRRRRTKKEAPVDQVELPEDILIQILSRLPVKSLFQFKTVCKSWYSIINGKQFVKEHLNNVNSSHYNQHKNMLGVYIPNRKSKHCLLYKEISDGSLLVTKCVVPFDVVQVRNYCNGLICFITPGNGILVWNPSLPLEYKIIPKDYKMKRRSKLVCFSVGMGYHSTRDDYKIVKVPKSTDKRLVDNNFFFEVFSLKSNSWSMKEISKNFTYTIQEKKCVYTRNRLHWIGKHFLDDEGKRTEFIVYFDMVEEKLDRVNLPGKSGLSYASRQYPLRVQMFDYKDSVAILDQDALWVLVDYNGMKSSWNKIFERGRRTRFLTYCFTRDGKILIKVTGQGLRTYDTKDGSIKDVKILGDNIISEEFDFFPYAESLVSPILK